MCPAAPNCFLRIDSIRGGQRRWAERANAHERDGAQNIRPVGERAGEAVYKAVDVGDPVAVAALHRLGLLAIIEDGRRRRRRWRRWRRWRWRRRWWGPLALLALLARLRLLALLALIGRMRRLIVVLVGVGKGNVVGVLKRVVLDGATVARVSLLGLVVDKAIEVARLIVVFVVVVVVVVVVVRAGHVVDVLVPAARHGRARLVIWSAWC
jgi:hypothetical protein